MVTERRHSEFVQSCWISNLSTMPSICPPRQGSFWDARRDRGSRQCATGNGPSYSSRVNRAMRTLAPSNTIAATLIKMK